MLLVEAPSIQESDDRGVIKRWTEFLISVIECAVSQINVRIARGGEVMPIAHSTAQAALAGKDPEGSEASALAAASAQR